MTQPSDTDTYPAGSIKHNPQTLAVAVKNVVPMPSVCWGVMTVDQGGHLTGFDEVKDWLDLPTGDGS